MRKKSFLLQVAIFLVLSFWSCTNRPATEKYQKERDRIVNVYDRVKEIALDGHFFNDRSVVIMAGNYLLINDFKSYENQIYLFDKYDFSYITSFAPVGQGPGEIANIGFVYSDDEHRRIYINDHAKQRIFSYDLDSVLANPFYIPEVRLVMNEAEFPSWYCILNDTLSLGEIIRPIGNSDFTKVSAKWEIKKNKITPMEDLHPEVEKKRYSLAASVKQGLFVECYNYHDLMTIRTIDGDLKYNIYGPLWSNGERTKRRYYRDATFCGDKLIALFYSDKNARSDGSQISDRFHIFSLNGDYVKTLKLGCKINFFCYDEENNRLILNMDDEIQFGYLDLEGLLD